MARALKISSMTVIYLVGICLFLEVGLRLWSGIPPLKLTNFRLDHKVDDVFTGFVEFNKSLGWTMKAHLDSGTMGTIDYGIRRNSKTHTTAKPGGWLVVGSSFTAGSGADDANTWPALLEKKAGVSVNNAAVGGYAVDQVVLRAESLLDKLKPEMLLIDLMYTTIRWTGYSVLTRPKPYFIVENGELKRPVPEVPRVESKPVPISAIMHYAAYSYVVDRVMATIDAQKWYARSRDNVVNAPGNPTEVSCALLRRIDRETSKRKIRLVVVSIPTGQELLASEDPASLVAQVEECATDSGIQIVDVRQQLHDDIRDGKVEQKELFQISAGKPVGHMTIEGNAYVAKVVNDNLKKSFKPKIVDRSKRIAVDALYTSAGDLPVGNLLPYSEGLSQSFSRSGATVLTKEPASTEQYATFRLRNSVRLLWFLSNPDQKIAPPLVVSHPETFEAGRYVFSAFIKPDGVQKAKLRMSSGNKSIMAGFDFKNEFAYVVPSHFALGRNWAARIRKESDGWYQISLSIEMQRSLLTLMIGLGDEYNAVKGDVEKVSALIRSVQFEAGTSPSAYKPTVSDNKLQANPGDGVNLLPDEDRLLELLPSTEIVRVSSSRCGLFNLFSDCREYSIRPTGGNSEHYSRFRLDLPGDQSYTLSGLVKPIQSTRLRLQLFDDKQTGAIADFNFWDKDISSRPVAEKSKFRATMSAVEDGWYKILLSVQTTSPGLVVTLQPVDSAGNTGFVPDGEELKLRELRIER